MNWQARRTRCTVLPSAAVLVLAPLAGTAGAQTMAPTAPAATPAPAVTIPAAAVPRSTGVPQRDTLIRMTRPVTIEFKEHRLEDVMRFITEVTQADTEVFWQDDKNSLGLDKAT